jgi:hypothetical protein
MRAFDFWLQSFFVVLYMALTICAIGSDYMYHDGGDVPCSIMVVFSFPIACWQYFVSVYKVPILPLRHPRWWYLGMASLFAFVIFPIYGTKAIRAHQNLLFVFAIPILLALFCYYLTYLDWKARRK